MIAVAVDHSSSNPDSVLVELSSLFSLPHWMPQLQPDCIEPPVQLCSVSELLPAPRCAVCKTH